RPVLAVDVALLRLHAGQLQVLVVRRRESPHAGRDALPGVALRADESLADAAQRALAEKCALAAAAGRDLHLEQLAVFDGLRRDPRGRAVSVAYLGLLRGEAALAKAARWPAAASLRGLAFDHDAIVALAVKRLRGKLRYSDIAAHLVADTFRSDELRAAYEAILGRSLNRSNFRTKLTRIGLIEQIGIDDERGGAGRPAHRYRFRRWSGERRDFL
ncbi:MAG: NUDIX domain-containing protein, partial [Deltaproteobacteria bacterium]|nr:NUDIX domain-containing protein [Deltaproteobacteria bacterium]